MGCTHAWQICRIWQFIVYEKRCGQREYKPLDAGLNGYFLHIHAVISESRASVQRSCVKGSGSQRRHLVTWAVQWLANVVIAVLGVPGANPNIPWKDYSGLQNYTVLHFEAYDGNRWAVLLIKTSQLCIDTMHAWNYVNFRYGFDSKFEFWSWTDGPGDVTK